MPADMCQHCINVGMGVRGKGCCLSNGPFKYCCLLWQPCSAIWDFHAGKRLLQASPAGNGCMIHVIWWLQASQALGFCALHWCTACN